MSSPLDKAVGYTLILGTVAVAGSVVYRNLATQPASQPNRTLEQPTFQEDWLSTLDYGITIVGGDLARVTIQEFTDLECPACRVYHPRLVSLAKEYPRGVRLVYMPYPLAMHRFAMGAARAADCISERYADLISGWIDVVYENQDSLGLKSWGALALETGVPDTGYVSACARTQPTGERILSTLAYGDRLAINGTPTIMVNGWLYRGLPTIDEVRSMVGQMLARSGPTDD
jgi:protein-disulfide isomerase